MMPYPHLTEAEYQQLRQSGIAFPSSKFNDEKPDAGPESILSGKIKRWAKDHGFVAQVSRQSKNARGLLVRGLPDVILALPGGVTLWIELKSQKGRLKKEQKQIALQLMACGHRWYQVRSYKRFLEIVNKAWKEEEK
jgi:hypothetical protein